MSDNIIDLMSDSREETLYGSFHDSHDPYLNSHHIWLEVISISDDYGSEGMSETSLEEETSSSRSLDALISDVGKNNKFHLGFHAPSHLIIGWGESQLAKEGTC